MLSDHYLSQYIERVQARVRTLYQNAQQTTVHETPTLTAALDELKLAVEELHVAEEELVAQTEQLAIAQQQAEFERQRYQHLFEFAPDGYVVTDLNGVVQEANQAAATLLNLQQQYLMGKPLVTFVVPAERTSFRTLLNQFNQNRIFQRVQGWELTLQRRNGEVFVASVTVSTVPATPDRAIAMRWQMRDISDRKRAEATLNQLQIQNAELLEADRLRTQLLATVSHEFKTPMHAILGFSQILLAQDDPQQDAKTRQMVERIFHNGQHLLAMIEDMLNVSRLRVDQVPLKLGSFDLADLVSSTVDDLAPLAEQKALPLEINLPDRPFMVVNDRVRLRQIIINLVANAIKFTDAGRVVVSLAPLPNECLRLQVTDTGCGISPEDQRFIFQEFWQVHDAYNQAQGSGLGLAIVHALVQVMQGTITVTSEVGRGSQFRIELPQIVTPGPSLLPPHL